MYAVQLRGSLYALVADLERTSLDSWRNVNAPGYSVVDALALHASSVDVEISRLRGGNVSVTVSVVGYRDTMGETYYFRLRKARDGFYEVLQGA